MTDITRKRVETLASGIGHLQNSAQMRRLAAEMVRALRTALDEAEAERDRLRAENDRLSGEWLKLQNIRLGSEDFKRAETATAERDALKALVVQMREALDHVRAIISDGAMDGFNYKYGDWAERLFKSQHVTREALSLTPADLSGCVVVPREKIEALSSVAHHAWHALDDSEDCGDDGHQIMRQDADNLEAALTQFMGGEWDDVHDHIRSMLKEATDDR